MESKSVKILYNREIAPGYFRLGLSWRTPRILPGQFVMLKVSDGLDPLLRRPFGISMVLSPKGKTAFCGSGIEVLYRVVGKGTKILSLKEKGEGIDILGPLGNGFPEHGPGKNIIMAAGGMGIAPLYLLAKKLMGGTLLFGARTGSEAVFARGFREFNCRIRVSSEDGSAGKKGLVTDLLAEEALPGSIIYACGPAGMLKAVAGMAGKEGARCYVSLERGMACGIGVCLGCAVRAKTHEEEAGNKTYRMVCSEGPVFNSEDIDWEAL